MDICEYFSYLLQTFFSRIFFFSDESPLCALSASGYPCSLPGGNLCVYPVHIVRLLLCVCVYSFA